ncbi:tRNA (adenosine(37)-N6)-threonylcarbamoyltransferase complex dimerization subunit type 1 TsaB [Spongiactinospora rosea]|uniref:tRNA (Adenosine(37)-N6)-threonylcarbamoyltransferase complex dimerization subunit type 1 TsaB n=1 Tax=Spongiactinospora rosea TaxID=2248750 RepID=A0A366LSZ9_9ACTN|nr:tRNA (adenosine(37)-N6)-threonylcarbamoyltransferase complex dimerization subunit type 1 TsaB [Spongiactinospora rosea]RBQ16444.1 tRNA (adenosine(37)-N6)-threonylcarbamoyltransferase complex dimerization subunit type 1 TsaB [Spongiactinospora rosea]
MLVLAFDTATPAVTAAIYDGARVLAESTTIDARRHGELLIPAVQAVLREAGATPRELTAIVAGTGPGPYTGLRVGLATAQALAAAAQVPAYGVGTLDALAHAAGMSRPFIAATDARRKEVFWARYAADGTREAGPFVDRPHDLPAELPVIGAGGLMYAEIIGPGRVVQDAPEHPSAGALAAIAAARITAGAELDPPLPIYLRRPDAQVPGAPKRVTA